MKPHYSKIEEHYNLGKHRFGKEGLLLQASYTQIIDGAYSKERFGLDAVYTPQDAILPEGFPLDILLEKDRGRIVRREVNGMEGSDLLDFSQWNRTVAEKIKRLPTHILKLIDLR